MAAPYPATFKRRGGTPLDSLYRSRFLFFVFAGNNCETEMGEPVEINALFLADCCRGPRLQS
jgi:hypothetical protein